MSPGPTADTIELKGVRLRRDGLTPESEAYLERKLERVRRRRARQRNPLHRLQLALLPRDYRDPPVEDLVAGRILVVGCGGGIEVLALGAVGIEIDRAALRVAASLRRAAEGAAAEFLAACAGDLPFAPAAFDCALSDNVVEHLPDRVLRHHLREMQRVLKPGGRYILTTPNRVFEVPPAAGHVSLHSYAEWEALLRDARFTRVLTPRHRSGPWQALAPKRREEARRARGRSRRGLSVRGLRLVTLIATKSE